MPVDCLQKDWLAVNKALKYYLFIFIVTTKCTIDITTGARCWWRSWLRHCATSRKVAGSIPEGFIVTQ